MQQGGVPSSLPGEPSSFLNSDLMHLAGDVWGCAANVGASQQLGDLAGHQLFKSLFRRTPNLSQAKGAATRRGNAQRNTYTTNDGGTNRG